MSVNTVNKTDGSLQMVAGKTSNGELIPSVSYYQSGQKTSDTTSWSTGETGTFSINLSENMPDTDYIVVPTLSVVGVSAIVHSKTVNSFKVTVRNDRAETVAVAITLYWQAFKLMTDENRALDETAIAQNTSDISDLQDDKQDKTLETPLTIDGTSQTTVEGALGGLNEVVSKTEKTLSIGGSASAIVKIGVSVPFLDTDYGKFTEIDFQVRSDNIRFFISANDGTYLVTAQHNYRSAGWLTGLYYLVNDSKSISLYVGILNYPADVGAKLVFNGLDGAEITEISTVSALPSGYASMKQFPVIYTSDLTSSITSGSNAPITSGGVYNALSHRDRKTRRQLSASDLTALKAAITSGDFGGIDIKDGDYFSGASGLKYTLGEFNHFKGSTTQYSVIADNHYAIVVDCMDTTPWNSGGDATDAYKASTLRTYLTETALPKVLSDMQALGFTVISRQCLESHTFDSKGINRWGKATGCSTGWEWLEEQIIALSEPQVYGSIVAGSSFLDVGEANRQLNCFKEHSFMDIADMKFFWLKEPSSSGSACVAFGSHGHAGGNDIVSYSRSAFGLIVIK